MKRGDIVTAVLPSELGKPRPVLILQSDYFADLESVTVIPLTSVIKDAPLLRLTIEPSQLTGLRKPSQLMIDKISTIRRSRLGGAIGSVDSRTMVRVKRAVALFVGLV
jgi:mRNA interferase MazF